MSLAQFESSARSPEQQGIADLAYALGAKYADRDFDDHDASLAQWAELAEVGLTGLSLPEAFGGGGGMFELCIASERLAAGGYPAAKLVIATAIAGSILERNARDDQRERWLPGMAEGSIKFCFALTEPSAGSNARNLRTTARREDGVWKVRGEKTYISALESSDAMMLVAKDAATGKLLLFAFPLPHAGLSTVRVPVDAPAFEYQWSVFFDDLELDDDALIGGVDGGGKALFDGLNPERLIVGSQAIGLGRWCLANAVDYAKQRVVFDVAIGAHQAVQHPLAEALIRLEGGWALVERAARLYDTGSQAGAESNIAKVAACDAGLLAADKALQTFGGSGFTSETRMFQRFSYLRLLQTVPVARELALNHIATAALGLPRSY